MFIFTQPVYINYIIKIEKTCIMLSNIYISN